ncbi:recombinase family protein [Erythrobacter aurantius]|uniref:recombinase family protein n=1 Tax=Erythrobacter aurantius TaxID=2909249 RepID=UPI0020797B88|nr:recombinase family protein [Erythrobacter aurantius]
MKSIRCAIYTRKSSDEGLEQDFNSLDAQREACAAYVLSQASEGWKLVPDHYDDGGLSGGTLERPSLQRLLGDVKQGLVDIIVVYKVDRLTRSLLDFSKLVETFDEAKVSFVSVTQSFNTTTSMGRLTLNMLLSFAQFEREVTAERIRDKIAASKAKGMWMGGVPPLGYKPDGRSLAIFEEHAAIVRDIFHRYRNVGKVRQVAEELAREGIHAPLRLTANGKSYGGRPFSRGNLYHLLKNPIYSGDIAHKDKTYSGMHEAIIPKEEWEAVQQQLTENTQGTRKARQQNRSLLAGILFDEHGRPLQAVHTCKGNKRYRYYVSRTDDLTGVDDTRPVLRMPAKEIEQVVRGELRKLLIDPLTLAGQAGLHITPAVLGQIQAIADESYAMLIRGGSTLLRDLISKAVVYPNRLTFELSCQGIAELFELSQSDHGPGTITHETAVRLTRSGLAMRLVHDGGVPAAPREPDPALLRLLLQARAWWAELAKGETDIAKLSRKEGMTASWMTRVVRLVFLAPEVVEAVLAGRVGAGLDAKSLLASGGVDANWSKQRAHFLPLSKNGLA